MTFTAKDVADLRQTTGAGMMECKNALKEANGNIERAREILRQKGLVAAAKKSEKSTLEGIVVGSVSSDRKSGVILEINTQTDFVAKNDQFKELSNVIAEAVLTQKPKTVDELVSLKVNGALVSELISIRVATIGENIQVRRFELFELTSNGAIGTYIHPVGNKIGVMIKISTNSQVDSQELEQLAKNLSMHIAAAQPQAEFINKDCIPKEIIEDEKRIELGKEDLAKKPKEIAEKIVQGRLDKILAQRCLLHQPYIKDPAIIVEKLIADIGKKLNTEIKVEKFTRYNVGESLEKSTQKEQSTPVSV